MPPGEQKHERVELPMGLRGEVTVLQPIAITQVSEGGMRIETGHPLHLDSLHDFRLTLDNVTVVVKGRIVHCRITDVEQETVTYRAGVEFIEPSEHARTAIAGFIEELKLRQADRRAASPPTLPA
jgi:hypothetical protein